MSTKKSSFDNFTPDLPSAPQRKGSVGQPPLSKDLKRSERVTIQFKPLEMEKLKTKAGRVNLATYLYHALREHEDMRDIFL